MLKPCNRAKLNIFSQNFGNEKFTAEFQKLKYKKIKVWEAITEIAIEDL